MIAAQDISLLREPSLQNRHMAGLNLTTRQMHVWSELLAIGGNNREDGKWRGFSPLDAMVLYVMRDIKERTNVALAKQKNLIKFLSNPDLFARRVLDIWTHAKTPVLATDFSAKHDVAETSDGFISLSTAALQPLLIVLDLEPLLRSVFDSTLSGGTEEQKALIHRLYGRRDVALNAAAETKPKVRSRQAPMASGTRRLDRGAVIDGGRSG